MTSHTVKLFGQQHMFEKSKAHVKTKTFLVTHFPGNYWEHDQVTTASNNIIQDDTNDTPPKLRLCV